MDRAVKPKSHKAEKPKSHKAIKPKSPKALKQLLRYATTPHRSKAEENSRKGNELEEAHEFKPKPVKK